MNRNVTNQPEDLMYDLIHAQNKSDKNDSTVRFNFYMRNIVLGRMNMVSGQLRKRSGRSLNIQIFFNIHPCKIIILKRSFSILIMR